MRRLGSARGWFAIAAVLTLLALFVLHGPAGGVVAAAAAGTLIFACFRALRGKEVDDRAAGAGWFGNYF
jgi:hypothetical protein